MPFEAIEGMEKRSDLTLAVVAGDSIDPDADIDPKDELHGLIELPAELEEFIKQEVLRGVPVVSVYGQEVVFIRECASITFAIVSHSPNLVVDEDKGYFEILLPGDTRQERLVNTLYFDLANATCDVPIVSSTQGGSEPNNYDFLQITVPPNVMSSLMGQFFHEIIKREDCGIEEYPLLRIGS